MLIKYKKFLFILSVLLCFCLNFYNLEQFNTKHKSQTYKTQQEQLNKLTEQLKKENNLHTNLNQRQIQRLFKKLNKGIEAGKKIDNNDLFNKKKKEFIDIMQIKLSETMNTKGSFNNSSGNYIKKYSDITAIKIGNLDILQVFILCSCITLFSGLFILAYWTFIANYFIQNDNILYLTTIYSAINSVVLLFFPITYYPLFYAFHLGRI